MSVQKVENKKPQTTQQVKNAMSGQSHLAVQASQSPLLYLQQTAGNQAVQGMLQAKLKAGRTGDAFEQEADKVADQVMRMPEPEIRFKPS